MRKGFTMGLKVIHMKDHMRLELMSQETTSHPVACREPSTADQQQEESGQVAIFFIAYNTLWNNYQYLELEEFLYIYIYI